MIDETALADPTRCPDCSAPLTTARDVCPACGLVLSGPLAGRLWQVSVQTHELLRTRAGLIAELRAHGTPAAAPGAAPAGVAAAPDGAARPGRTPRPRTEWSARRVQNLLLALGVGLLGVAAVIFVAVSWDRLGVGGRSAVMAGITALAGFGAVRAHRRGLLSTAEWLSLLTVGLGVLDCYGARSSDLAGLGAVDGQVFWAGALAVVAGLTALLTVVLPARVLPVTAALLSQLPLLLVADHLVVDAARPLALAAALLAVQAVVDLAAVAVWPSGSRTRDARVVLAVGGALAHLLASSAAGAAAYTETGSLVVGTGLLLVLAGVLAVAGTLLAGRPRVAPALPWVDGLAATLVVAGLWAPVVDRTPDRWLGPALGAAALAVLAATLALPAARRRPAAVVLLVAGLAPMLAATETVADAAERALAPIERPWAGDTSTAAWAAGWPDVLSLLAVAAALLLGAHVLRLATGLVVAVPVLAVAAALAAPAAGAGYPVQLGLLGLVGAALLVTGARLVRQGRAPAGWAALWSGAVGLVLMSTWSFAVPAATIAALPGAAAALLAGALAAAGPVSLRPWRVALVTGTLVLGLVEAGAATRDGGAGWPAVWSVVLVLAVVVAVGVASGLAARTAAADVFWAPLHTAAVVAAAAAAVAGSGAVAGWQDVAVAGSGLAAACTAALLLAASAVPAPPTRRPVRGAVQVVSVLAAGPAVAAAALDGDRLWVALLALGVGVAVVAVTPERHPVGWVAGVVLAGSSWVRLALSDVDAPEAYTVPGGVALLVVGFLRRRRDPAYGSWQAYGSGLSLALVPSLLRAVTDAGDLRPLLLAVVAAGVVAAGAARRLQAPLLVGAGVLAVDALVQLAPYLATAYDVVPRWLTIGVLGLLLLVAGATYEQRVRDLRRVGRHVARLG